MEKLKKIIICFIIVIVIILIFILFLKNRNNVNEVNNENYLEEGEETVPEKDNNGYIDVSDANIFYSVLNSVNKYISIMQHNIDTQINEDDIYRVYSVDNEYLLNIKTEKQRLEAIYELLDENYKESNYITINNVRDFLYDVEDNTVLIPIQMKAKYGTNINTFILKTYLSGDRLEEKYFIIRTNNENHTFSIEFINDDETDIEKIKFNENDDIIEKNDYNDFKIEIIRTEKISQMYLEHYRSLSIQYPEIIYNNYLDKEYRAKRFGTLENYEKYIEDNKNEMEYIQITKYMVETEGNETKYIVLDQYENTYVFTETALMQYSVTLDTYTIESEKFKSTYNSSDDQNKVMMNVDKFIMMLNSRDYSSAYNLLDDTFKKNTFGAEEKFEEYIRNEYPLHYKIKYSSFEKKGSNIFVQKVKLTDITEMDTNIIELTIIMRLDQGTSFTMSFEV